MKKRPHPDTAYCPEHGVDYFQDGKCLCGYAMKSSRRKEPK